MSHRRMIQPPDDMPVINGRRAAAVILSAAVLVATLFGYLAQRTQPQHIPMDNGTPPTVTTLANSWPHSPTP